MDKDKFISASIQPLMECFDQLDDPRVAGRCLHKLIDIIVITVCAVICGAKQWEQIAEFGKQRDEWLRRFLELPNGIPSYKTFCRIFCIIPANQFENCFRHWALKVQETQLEEVVAIDGKTLCNSSHKAVGQGALHLVNAYATRQGITLGVEKTPDKSNEIRGIANLLKSLELPKCTVTIDAMGCQKGIAKLIRMKKADYVLALKENHKRFYRKVANLFTQAKHLNDENMLVKHHCTTNSDHSRGERREYTCLPFMYLPLYQKQWADVKTLVEVKSTRHSKGTKETATRYYISSLHLRDYLRLCSAVREHWQVENRLHWKLDVAFREDDCRIFKAAAAQNFSSIRKIALFYLENESSCLKGIEFKQWKAAMNTQYLQKVVGF